MTTKLIMLMAPPCVGKTIIANYIKDTHNNCKIISKKDLLKMYPKYDIFSTKLNKKYCEAINSALQYYDIVVADDTQTTLESRIRVFENLNLKNVKVIGVWIEAALKSALQYNNTRSPEEYIDPYVLKEIFRYSVSPIESEPFDKIIYINKDNSIGLSKDNPKIQDIFQILADI